MRHAALSLVSVEVCALMYFVPIITLAVTKRRWCSQEKRKISLPFRLRALFFFFSARFRGLSRYLCGDMGMLCGSATPLLTLDDAPFCPLKASRVLA